MSEKNIEVTLSANQLQELLARTVEAAVKAAREPDDLTKAKLAQEAEEAARRREEMLEMGRVEEQSRKDRWANCSHKKDNGKPCVGGQIHSDGLVHLFCLRCQFPFEPFPPSNEMVATGF